MTQHGSRSGVKINIWTSSTLQDHHSVLAVMVAPTDAIVSVNVGGRKFCSSRETILKVIARSALASRDDPLDTGVACSGLYAYF